VPPFAGRATTPWGVHAGFEFAQGPSVSVTHVVLEPVSPYIARSALALAPPFTGELAFLRRLLLGRSTFRFCFDSIPTPLVGARTITAFHLAETWRARSGTPCRPKATMHFNTRPLSIGTRSTFFSPFLAAPTSYLSPFWPSPTFFCGLLVFPLRARTRTTLMRSNPAFFHPSQPGRHFVPRPGTGRARPRLRPFFARVLLPSL